ncbi:NUDIX domain-containing protein [Salinibacterium sp. ZJ454]|uniref:NUDIX hydrolase n=1 Tax=Salinibacterium sp. ZJ454 TaxID=2708339 RepID=UPI001FB9C404|nr:NUDIX domain-containing protein [Salinibacterium sp. ZJ454]
MCWKISEGKVKILLVHRTQHKDVSLPKGKLDPGETLPQCAVREIAEETGLAITLGAPLGTVEYTMPNGRSKIVHYWQAEVGQLAIANSTFVSNDEIEALQWVSLKRARRILSYAHDVELVERFAERLERGRARTFAIIAVRHGKATPPEQWDGPDATRPLIPKGCEQARGIAAGIAAYRPVKLITSNATRCVDTITPTAELLGMPVKETETISQDAYQAGNDSVQKVVHKRLAHQRTAVICSHGPVLPELIGEIAHVTGTPIDEELRRATMLATGEFSVLHVSLEHPEGGLVAVETHGPAL